MSARVTLLRMATYVGDALLAHAKAGCYICLRGDRLVDTDVQIEGEGILAVCAGCVAGLAEAAGLTLNGAAVAERDQAFQEERRHFDVERVARLEEALAAEQRTVEIAENTIASLQDALDRVSRRTSTKASAR